jgi:CheY-like chemotaxis protein
MRKKKILLTDDEPDIVLVFKAILEKNNYEVVIARDGIEGLRKATEEKPGLILLDIKMPNKDGMEMLRELKQDKSTKHIPVIMLTVSIGTPPANECFKLGAKDYLFKTCETEILLESIKKNIL